MFVVGRRLAACIAERFLDESERVASGGDADARDGDLVSDASCDLRLLLCDGALAMDARA